MLHHALKQRHFPLLSWQSIHLIASHRSSFQQGSSYTHTHTKNLCGRWDGRGETGIGSKKRKPPRKAIHRSDHASGWCRSIGSKMIYLGTEVYIWVYTRRKQSSLSRGTPSVPLELPTNLPTLDLAWTLFLYLPCHAVLLKRILGQVSTTSKKYLRLAYRQFTLTHRGGNIYGDTKKKKETYFQLPGAKKINRNLRLILPQQMWLFSFQRCFDHFWYA